MTKPTLSVIIPMRENVPEHWLKELSNIKGNVEFILVYPPLVKKLPNIDSRIQQITSALRGEVIQRITALLNASGTYVLSINCDEYLTPNIEQIARQYFERFPNSWFVRLRTESYPYGSQDQLVKEWEVFPSIKELKVKTKADKNLSESETLKEISISPLENKFDPLCLFRPFPGRKDHHGIHQENFDKKIWKNSLIQESLADIVEKFTIFGALKYIPFWCSDRLLGLSMQAKLYQKGVVKKGQIIAHWLPKNSVQIRTEDNPPQYRGKNRRYVLGEILLLKLYPQYGYFWNLILSQWRTLIKS
jgi:hypothetical protein